MNIFKGIFEKADTDTKENTKVIKQKFITLGIEQNENQNELDDANQRLEHARGKDDIELVEKLELLVKELTAEKTKLEKEHQDLEKQQKAAENRFLLN